MGRHAGENLISTTADPRILIFELYATRSASMAKGQAIVAAEPTVPRESDRLERRINFAL